MGRERAGAVTRGREELETPPMHIFVVRRKERGAAGPVDRRRHSSRGALPVGQSDRRARCLLVAAGPFRIKPPLELGVSACHKYALEQRSAVQLERTLEITGSHGDVKREYVAPQAARRDPDLLLPAGGQYLSP